MSIPLDLDGPPDCYVCGGSTTLTHHPDEDGLWLLRCPGCEAHWESVERPSWRSHAAAQRLVAEIERLRSPPSQPAPAPGEGDVWAEVIGDLPPGPFRSACEARRQLGIERYGRPLQRGNGRDAQRDLREELLDGMAYARQAGDGEAEAALVALLSRPATPRTG